MTDAGRGLAYALVAAVCYGMSVAVAKLLLVEMSWTTVALARFAVASVVLWSAVILTRAKTSLTRRQAAQLVTASLLVTGGAIAGTFALQTVPAWLVVAVLYTYPALVAVISRRIGVALTGPAAMLAVALAVAGVLLSVQTGMQPIGGAGLLVVLATPFIYAALFATQGLIAGERVGQTGSARQRLAGDSQRVPALVYAAYVVLIATMVMVPLVVFVGDSRGLVTIPRSWPEVSLYAVTAAVLPIPLVYAAVRQIGVARVAIVSSFEVVAAAIASILLLGDSLTPLQVVGAGLVVTSAVLVASTTPEFRAKPLRIT